jgi:peptidoglycan/LPS O-acetylase OafA/YrhL
MKRTFFGTLESLRGVAAFLVVLAHMPPVVLAFKDIPFIQHGVLMVPFFFVLSGFVICYNYYDSISDKAQLFRFVFLRFFSPISRPFRLSFGLAKL